MVESPLVPKGNVPNGTLGVKMKKALLKDSLKEIKNTYRRFISILLMAFLGVGFFAGIRATAPDMVDTVDKYFDNKNVYDMKLLSTLGLTEDDIIALKQIDGIEGVYGEYSEDILLNFEDTELVTKVLSLDEVNQVSIIEGRMPENSKECLVEKSFCTQTGKTLGDIVTIEETEDSIIKEKEVVIVGTMNSPLYASRERDTSKLGSGRVSYNMYLPKESFDSEVYTEVYLTLEKAKEYQTDSTEYKEVVEQVKEKIEGIKEERQEARYQEIKIEAEEELNKAKTELEEEKQKAESEIQEKENEITQGQKSLQNAQATLNANQKQAKEQFTLAQTQIQEAKEQVLKQEQDLPNLENKAQQEIEKLNAQKEQLQPNLTALKQSISSSEEQLSQVKQELQKENLNPEEKQVLEAQKTQIENSLTMIKGQKETLDATLQTIENAILKIQTELQQGKEALKQGKVQIQNQEEELQKSQQNANSEFQKAQAEINNSKTQLEEGKTALASAKEEYQEKMEQAEKEIEDAEEEIQKIEKPTWYILDRSANTGYNSFIQDTQSVENLGKVFPIVFFVIATLISLTSMTRMVEEQRVQIGTMKALGYNKVQIAGKYLLYAALACIIGGSIGMLVGFILLPKIIWMMYSMMYVMPDISIHFNWHYAILGLGLASICIIGATLYTALSTLNQTPSELMRPKAPKPGKRVLLEKIPFIWKHLSFTRKVTVRNIFRYKKRFLMTIIGIAGCTALILAGFGIKDAISAILPNQYEKVYHYQMQISLKSGITNTELENLMKSLQEKQGIKKIVETQMTSGTLVNKGKEQDVQMIIPKEENLQEVIHLADSKTKETVNLQNNKIAITEKVAELINVQKGDTIILKDADEKQHEVQISNIVENYIYHYVYMPKELYEKLYEPYSTNVLLVEHTLNNNQAEDALSKELLEKEEVSAISLNSSIQNMMNDMMSSLNYVVIVLIVSAGLLAFVVLYNLSNVNISERIRELATIKVLGFYDKEVYQYITRETVILTAIGIVLGLIGGYFLNYFIMGTCEINVLRFSKEIRPISYLYAVIITIIFTTIVNIVTYFSLKKIDMIESLKSIE